MDSILRAEANELIWDAPAVASQLLTGQKQSALRLGLVTLELMTNALTCATGESIQGTWVVSVLEIAMGHG